MSLAHLPSPVNDWVDSPPIVCRIEPLLFVVLSMWWWILLFSVGLVSVILVVYNRMVALETRARASLGDIDTFLKKRHDLIPNLLSIVKGYSAHEQKVFTEVAALRSEATAMGGPLEGASLEQQLGSKLNNFFVLMEAYPELQASEQYRSLHRSLVDIEDQLSRARRYYNAVVRDYNTLLHTFPFSLLARSFGRQALHFFAVDHGERATPSLTV